MFAYYTPSKEELEALRYKPFLHYRGDRDDIPDQETLIGFLVRTIKNFDYYYAYSDSLSTWRAGEANYAWVLKHINKISDPNIRTHLQRCFNAQQAEEVTGPFPWGRYVDHLTTFVRAVFEGETIERASYLTGLREWVDHLEREVSQHSASHRVVYADNYTVASKILKEGLYWFNNDHQLQPITIPANLYAEIEHLGKLYKANEIKFSDLKKVKPYTVQAMLDGKAEVILIGNFYMVFTYNTRH